MGLFDKFKKPKEPPRQQRSGVMELIFCPAESLEHIMGRMESALGVHSPGTGNRISIYQDDMHIDFTGFVADKETENGKKAQEQPQGCGPTSGRWRRNTSTSSATCSITCASAGGWCR